jgi:hypothetical protein
MHGATIKIFNILIGNAVFLTPHINIFNRICQYLISLFEISLRMAM